MPGSVDAPFLVKRARGSFGEGMQGPFRASDAAEIGLRPGEYAEAFMWGRIARAWYWADRLAALEVFDMPQVVGDGSSSYEALLRRTGLDVPKDFAGLARLQGVQPSDIVPLGQGVTCDYRYVSPFNPTVHANNNLLPKLADTPLAQRFADAGRRILSRIPKVAGHEAGFVLDAIVDATDQAWFLEINSNPQWHPDIYPAMLDAVCGIGSSALAQDDSRPVDAR